MATDGDGLDVDMGMREALCCTQKSEILEKPVKILTDTATSGDGVDGGNATTDARKRPSVISMDMETEGDGAAEETDRRNGKRKQPPTISPDTETEGDVDYEPHFDDCFCGVKWFLDEPAPPNQEEEEEEALEERLKILLQRSEEEESLLINKGDKVVLDKLLFTPERDYLMTKDGQKVRKDELLNKKKQLLLYIFPLIKNFGIKLVTRELGGLRNLLWDTGCFEIVFVGLRSNADISKQEKYFEKHTSLMSWPFIPFEDSFARESVRTTFGFSKRYVADFNCDDPYCGIVDPDGTVLQSWAWDILNYYGHDAFPFTDDKIISLYKEEASMFTEGVSLKKLLGSSNRDYVLSPKNDKVPIHDLENKVVGIILDDPAMCIFRTSLIKKVFNGVESTHPDFVLVYVCRHFPNTFIRPEDHKREAKTKAVYESVDWHRIPYGDSSARKIWRVILHRCREDEVFRRYCNIVGPRGSYVDFFAASCMERHGVDDAYPFTVKRSAVLVAQALMEDISLQVILQPARYIMRNGKPISVDDALALFGKRLLVLFGTHSCWELGQFLCDLKVLYNDEKGKVGEFEVLYVSFDCLRCDFAESTSRMPWLVFPYGKDMPRILQCYGYPWPWYGSIPAITAFEKGQLVGMEGNLHLKKDKRPEFPWVNSVECECIKKAQSDISKIPKDYEFWRMF